MENSAKSPGYVAKEGEERKFKHYVTCLKIMILFWLVSKTWVHGESLDYSLYKKLANW